MPLERETRCQRFVAIKACAESGSHFFSCHLVHLLLLVEADLAGTHVDEEEQTADDGQDLEEVVLGEVLVRVVLVELQNLG